MPLSTYTNGDGASLTAPRRGRQRVFGGWTIRIQLGDQEGTIRLALMTRRRLMRFEEAGVDPAWNIFRCGGLRVLVKVEPTGKEGVPQ